MTKVHEENAMSQLNDNAINLCKNIYPFFVPFTGTCEPKSSIKKGYGL